METRSDYSIKPVKYAHIEKPFKCTKCGHPLGVIREGSLHITGAIVIGQADIHCEECGFWRMYYPPGEVAVRKIDQIIADYKAAMDRSITELNQAIEAIEDIARKP